MTIDDIKARCRVVDGHWIWAGAMSDGWPRIWAPDWTLHGGKLATQTGRRAVWHVRTSKPIAKGWRVFGTCEEPACIAPAHMDCKDTGEQGAKVAASGRWKGNVRRIVANRTSGRKRSILTPEMITAIMASSKTGKALAVDLGISRQTISKARRGKATAFEPVGGLFSGLLAANDSKRKVA